MINCIEYTLKNFNRERTLTKILQVCEVKNVKIFDDTYSFQVNKKNKSNPFYARKKHIIVVFLLFM